MIREATQDDFPKLVEMGRAFHGESIAGTFSEFDDESFIETLHLLMTTGKLIVLLHNEDVIGMTGGILMQLYFNKHHIDAHELFTWVEPSSRGKGLRLFEVLEEWAESRGAKTFVIARVPGMRDEALHRIYEARGFVPTDNFYTKALCPAE